MIGNSFAETPLDQAQAVYKETELHIGKLDVFSVDVKRMVEGIEAMMGPLQGDVVFFYGVDKSMWDKLFSNLKLRDVLQVRAFAFTSLEKKTANKFASGGMVEIAAPKGTMCLPIDGIGEMELLLPRGMKMKVVGVDRDHKVISVVPVSQGCYQLAGNPSKEWII